MNAKKRFAIFILSAVLIICTAGCSAQEQDDQSEESTASQVQSQLNNADSTEMFTSRDMKTDYDEASAVTITLSDKGIKSSSDSVEVSSDKAVISDEGTYIISGSISDGQIVVNTEKTNKVQLVLKNAEINSNSSAPIYVKQADKVFITLAPKSENKLTNTKEFVADGDINVDSVIFSKDDLTLNGSGSLEINTTCGHGIVSKDDLVLTGGEYKISATGHALRGNDSVRIADGAYTITAGKDGIHAENSDDTSLGFIYIENGDFSITSDGDGMDSSSYTNIVNGKITINAGGGAENAETKRDDFARFYNGSQSDSTESSISVKGIKAEGGVKIGGGTFDINSADDALHSDSDVLINGGDITITAGDDGIHADNTAEINDGTINIKQSYEGIEGNVININGGTISVIASDDGINAAGGNDSSGFGGGMQKDNFSADSSAVINITGGKLTINADGDGVDSNGNLYVSGGETYVSGPESGGNGALDYDGEAQITGGIFVAAGDSGMAQNFGESSTQGSILYAASASGSGKVSIKDKSGTEILSFTPEKSYNSVVISCPEIKEGESYTIEMCSQTYEVEMTSLIYGGTNGMNGAGGMGGGKQMDDRGMGAVVNGKGMR